MKICILSTYLPTPCGIATFSHDLYQALKLTQPDLLHIIAMHEPMESTSYPAEVALTIHKHELHSYQQGATWINEKYDCCIIQHEFGIFGGDDGQHILALAEALTIPMVCNFHTILASPSANQQHIIERLTALSKAVTVMTQRAVEMLNHQYQVASDKIRYIPHGVPVFNHNQKAAKDTLGFDHRPLLLSFGFLGRNKGFEVALEALSMVPDKTITYVILGSTHPNVLKHEGESYRQSLLDKCQQLGIENQVVFINKFADDALLHDYLTACDIFITPYPHENQISSGTLTFALGAGAAVVSTPYWYAKDLLANDRGILFNFNDATALAAIIDQLSHDGDLLAAYRQRAKDFGQHMQWPNIGRQYALLIHQLLLQQQQASSTTMPELPA